MSSTHSGLRCEYGSLSEGSTNPRLFIWNGFTILVSTVHVKEFHRQITRAGWKFDHAEGSHYFYIKDGIFAGGDTIEACKKDVLVAIDLIKKNLPEDRWPAPIRGEFDIIWKYDTQSLLLHYGCIMSLSGLEQITGIHQKQLWSYMHGRTKPRAPQKQRIEFALHNFGKELSSLALI